jgi:hypothetical protein
MYEPISASTKPAAVGALAREVFLDVKPQWCLAVAARGKQDIEQALTGLTQLN